MIMVTGKIHDFDYNYELMNGYAQLQLHMYD